MNMFLLLVFMAPLLGALLGSVMNLYREGMAKYVGLLSITTAVIAAFILNIQLYLTNSPISLHLLSFLERFELTLQPDRLGIFMALIATFLGLLIALFSMEYMESDQHLTRYWFYLQLFITGMSTIVLASDLLTMYFGWEMVGLCSFGLISHWHEKPGEQGRKAGLAGIKAFIFTRIGDIGFLVVIVVVYHEVGSLQFAIINQSSLSKSTLQIAAWGLLLAAYGKSAQFPFIPWLSSPDSVDVDAMQGPTTVSALIHAATMVKAGVYLISRSYLIFKFWQLDQFVIALSVIAAITAIISAMSAMVSQDLKRILAYSTISQLAYMFLGLGLAFIAVEKKPDLAAQAFYFAQAHLLAHAIFKSLLFLTAGYLIHTYGSRNLHSLQGVARTDRIAAIGLLSGGLSLIGLPPFIGFFSKEGLLGVSFELLIDGEQPVLVGFIWLLAVGTALITAAYTTRFLAILFLDTPSTTQDNHHTPIMRGVILVLSGLAFLGGVLIILLPLHFEGLVDVSYHFPVGIALLHMVLITGAILIVMWYTTRQLQHERSSDSVMIRRITEVAAEGFYLEMAWMTGWKGIKYLARQVQRLHSGNLNKMVANASVLALTLTAVISGGMLF